MLFGVCSGPDSPCGWLYFVHNQNNCFFFEPFAPPPVTRIPGQSSPGAARRTRATCSHVITLTQLFRRRSTIGISAARHVVGRGGIREEGDEEEGQKKEREGRSGGLRLSLEERHIDLGEELGGGGVPTARVTRSVPERPASRVASQSVKHLRKPSPTPKTNPHP